MKIEKTNAMRLLDSEGIHYNYYDVRSDNRFNDDTDGLMLAQILGKDKERVFKTLVCKANIGEYIVFMIPGGSTLDLKKAAKCANVKSLEMIKQKDLLPVTSYIHGGCSPIGMKSTFRTFIEESAMLYDDICFSAGKRGMQIELNSDLLREFLIKYNVCEYGDLI